MDEFKNEFSWSKSRDGLFKECKRRYYLERYGYWNGWKYDAPENVKELYMLKNVKSRHIWIGNVVHDAIKNLLLKHKAGHKLELGYILSSLRKQIEGDFSSSKSKTYKKYPKTCGLFEHEYDILVSKDEWDELFKIAEKCIVNFYNSDTFKQIKTINPSDWVFLEDFLNFDFEGTKVHLMIDFAIKQEDSIVLYDWKTGKEREDKSIDMQLSSYALYVLQKWSLPPEKVAAKVYNAAIDKEDSFQITGDIIEDTKNYMRQSIQKMKSFLRDEENNIASIEDFPKTSDEYRCTRCSFKRVCMVSDQ